MTDGKRKIVESDDGEWGINVTPGRYFVALWFVAHPGDETNGGQDYLAAVYRDTVATGYTLMYRFRYYRDDKSFDSEDHKSWTRCAGIDKPEVEVEAMVDYVVKEMVAKGMRGPVTKLALHSGDPEFIIKRFRNSPFMHFKIEPAAGAASGAASKKAAS